jgi:integrase
LSNRAPREDRPPPSGYCCYKKALEKAKLCKLRFHDRRHTRGTIAIEQRSISRSRGWMGHADVQTTMKYLHHRCKAGDPRLLSAAFEPTKQTPARRRRAAIAAPAANATAAR